MHADGDGRRLFTVSEVRARRIYESGAACVKERRRRVVTKLQLLPSKGLSRTGEPEARGVGGTFYSVRSGFPDRDNPGLDSGRRAYRHCDEAILDYLDAFYSVMASVGADIVEDPAAESKRTCLRPIGERDHAS